MNRLQLALLVSSLSLALPACGPQVDLPGAPAQPAASASAPAQPGASGQGAGSGPGLVGGGVDPAQPKAAPADPSKTPSTSTTPGIKGKLAPPAASACASASNTPLTSEDEAKANGGVGLTGAAKLERTASAGERKGGLDKSHLLRANDLLQRGALLAPFRSLAKSGTIHGLGGGDVDTDGDCLSDAAEAKAGTDPKNPDTDGDGWFDGACNERRKLVLQSVKVHTSQDISFFGGDDFYIVADDIRYPHGDLDDYWSGWKTDTDHAIDQVIAQRTRGVAPTALQQVTVEGFDDDFEIFNTWTVDDLIVNTTLDLGAFSAGETITKRFTGDDWDYEVTFRVDVEHFADPNPLVDADSDNDGIKESAEAKVAVDFGGITDPTRPDVLVEVDYMAGHRLRTEAKRMVQTRLAMHGIHLYVQRDEEIALDDCLASKEAQAIYNAHFSNLGYDAFRYAVVGEQIWNDASGVAWGDIFLIDDSTWWINDMVLPQAGTFIHELGHTLGLTKELFPLIDSIAFLTYDSAMNYTFQALLVDYDSDGDADSTWRHNDWADVKPATALKWSFALVTADEKGICK